MPDRQMDDCLDFYLRPPGEDDGLYWNYFYHV